MALKFLAYPQFNDPALRHFAGMKHRIHSLPEELFPSESLPDRLARSLSAHRAIHVKELIEGFEFFMRVRKRIRRPHMVDLCAGHGLAGMIFALCEPSVLRVEVIDERKPSSFERIWAAFTEIAPWVAEKVTYLEQPLGEVDNLADGASLLLVHACGPLTDEGISLAAKARAPVAAMPCCYGKAYEPKVPGLNQPFGRAASIDISRSFRLADSGYQVDWTEIPEAITPMNRVIVGWNHRGLHTI